MILWNKMKNPMVSIILPTYNGKLEWLEQSIWSVFTQTYKNIEIIIINDWSTNQIDLWIKNIIDKHWTKNLIKFINRKENKWLSYSLNEWINNANGKYIARIDDDDIWIDCKKLEDQVSFLNNHPDYCLVGSGYIIVDEKLNEVKKVSLPNDYVEIFNSMLDSCKFAHSSVVFRKDVTKALWWYKSFRNPIDDHELRIRMILKHKVANLSKYCIYYRRNPNWMCVSNMLVLRIKRFFLVLLYSRIFNKNWSYIINYFFKTSKKIWIYIIH